MYLFFKEPITNNIMTIRGGNTLTSEVGKSKITINP
jgi:hypothetical protein